MAHKAGTSGNPDSGAGPKSDVKAGIVDALLKLAAALGLLPDDLANGAHAAYREFRRLQHAMRLQGERYARVDPAGVAEQVQAVLRLWEWVFGNIRRAPAQPE